MWVQSSPAAIFQVTNKKKKQKKVKTFFDMAKCYYNEIILFGHTTLREINHFYCRHLAQQIDCITKSGGSRLGIYYIENTLHITHVIYVQPVWPNATNAIRFVDSANEPWIFRFIIISMRTYRYDNSGTDAKGICWSNFKEILSYISFLYYFLNFPHFSTLCKAIYPMQQYLLSCSFPIKTPCKAYLTCVACSL